MFRDMGIALFYCCRVPLLLVKTISLHISIILIITHPSTSTSTSIIYTFFKNVQYRHNRSKRIVLMPF